MNKHQADLHWFGGHARTLRSDDALAITANGNEITYDEFNSLVRECADVLHRAGIRDNHRILILGDNDDIAASIIWTWAAIYLGASPGNASTVETREQILGKAEAAGCDAIVNICGKVEILSDLTKMSKARQEEVYILYSSGTTKKPEGVYGVEPQYFTYHEGWRGGIAHIDMLELAYRFLGEVPLNQIACHGWEVAYAPHNVVQCILSGGTYHWVESPADIPEAQAKYKTNMMSNYPLSYDPIIEAWANSSGVPPIEYVEVAGGICTPELIHKIRDYIMPRIISNSYISSASGTILSRTIDVNDDPTECVWLENPHLDPTLRLRMDDSNVLWYKRKDGPWITDSDVFKREGKYYKVIGKAAEEFITTKNGKISTWEVEQFANQLTRTVWGCGEHTYAFAMQGVAGEPDLGLVYSGPLDITLMKERMAKMAVHKRPDRIYQVKPEFWALNIKVSRDYMTERLYENQEYILNEL